MKHLKLFFNMIIVCGLVLAACAAPAPVAEPAAAAPAPATEAPKATEAPVATEAPAVEFTGSIVRFNTIADYEAATGTKITSFQQSPVLDALVAAGTLPPVEERLPDEPLVLQPAGQIGEYGGNAVHGTTDDGGKVGGMEDYLREFPTTYGGDMTGPYPNLILGWEVSADARITTIKFRPGHKWSDGAPFGADDFVFWYEAVALNKELSPSGISPLKSGGEMGSIRKIDESTIEVKFLNPYGFLTQSLSRWRPMPYLPAHYMKQFHPDYTDKATLDALVKERSFTNWTELFEYERYWYGNPNIPTVYAWKLVTEDATNPIQEYERNPWYFKVDTAGNQLPYIDKITVRNVGTMENMVLAGTAGELDFTGNEWFSGTINYPLLKQNEEAGGYKLVPTQGWDDDVATVGFNMSTKDAVLSELFNNKDFRIALSHGIDRETINEVIFFGQYMAAQPGPPAKSVYKGGEGDFLNYIEYDVDKANGILEGLGLTWNADKTKRFLPDGRPAEITAVVGISGTFPCVQVAELMAQNWKVLGLNVILVPLENKLKTERKAASDYEMIIEPTNFGGQAPVIGAMRGQPMPIDNAWIVNARWGQWILSDGEKGDEPPADVKRLYEIHKEFVGSPDVSKRTELEKEMYAIHNKNLWVVGSLRQPSDSVSGWWHYFSNRMYNYPALLGGEPYYSPPATWAFKSD